MALHMLHDSVNTLLAIDMMNEPTWRLRDTVATGLLTRCSAIAETALQGALYLSPKVEDWNWETIFYGYYRSIFNYCDIIGLKICRIP